jgi:hypothetical protein
MLAQYNLGTNYRQSTTNIHVTFSNSNGWEFTPGPKEIDIQQYDGDAKIYINEYVSYLKSETGDFTITGTLITLAELKILGCTIPTNYSITSGITCEESQYSSWLINTQNWWTRSARSDNGSYVWSLLSTGDISSVNYDTSGYVGKIGIRPIITISKSSIETTISFSINGKTYKANKDMTWLEWVNSPYNTANYQSTENPSYIIQNGWYNRIVSTQEYNAVTPSSTIIANYNYIIHDGSGAE